MKIVINKCFGGFSVSSEAIKLYYEKMEKPIYKVHHTNINRYREEPEYVYIDFDTKDDSFFCNYTNKPLNKDGTMVKNSFVSEYDFERTDPILIEVIEKLGNKANGRCADLKVVEIPDDVGYYIHEYDGLESIHEDHRSWG